MLSDDLPVFFKSKMAGVEQMELQMLQITLVRMCARRWKYLIFRTPDDQRPRLVFTKIGLPTGIERRIAAIVIEYLS